MPGISLRTATVSLGFRSDGGSGFSKPFARARKLIITSMYAQLSITLQAFRLRGLLTTEIISQSR